MLFIPGSVHIS